jgi:hypothetical protein
MQKSERSSYTPLDFLTWQESGALVLTPKFQRRGVWNTPARSYLIDTLIRGMPVPPIFLRVTQSEDKRRTVREVIDGQQRISAVLDFLNNKFALSSNLDAPYSKKYFAELALEYQDAIREYAFMCEIFSGIGDSEVLQIFSRLNLYSVPLNAQELRNGRFFGPFKQAAYSLATEHLEFWRKNRIFTERNIARMSEVELVSELMILELDGLQDKKRSIDGFYEKYDQQFSERRKVEERFRSVIDVISEALSDDILSASEFRRTPIFYSLFAAIFHRMFGMPKEELPTNPSGRLLKSEGEKLRDTVLMLSEKVIQAKQDEKVSQVYERFVVACIRQTDNIRPRQIRFNEIYKRAFL